MSSKSFAWQARVFAGLAGLGLLALAGAGQPTSPLNPPANGPRHEDPSWHALTNATVHARPDSTIEHATVVVRNGRIESVLPATGDKPATPPPGARIWDCTGLHIYPGFIDAYVEVDAPKPDPNLPGSHWNPRVTPQRSALDGTGVDDKTAESLRKLGFAAAAISPAGGVFRGRAAVVSLAKPASEMSVDRPPVYSPNAYHSVAFDLNRGGGMRPVGGPAADTGPDVTRWSSYPSSEMGAIALIRQTLIDEQWQQDARKAGQNLAYNSIDTLSPEWARNMPDRTVAAAKVGEAGGMEPMPLLFDTEDELEALRAAKIAREFKRPAILLGSGYEFRRLDAVKADGLPLILPLRFPKAPDVSTIGKAEGVDLREMMTWEQAPTNPRRLEAAGVKVALTSAKLRNRADFADALRSALKHGLKPESALAMLTTRPAEILGVSDRLGTIEKGKIANLVVSENDLFEAWPKKEETKKQKEGEKEEGAKADADPGLADDMTAGQPAGRGRRGQGGPGGPGAGAPGSGPGAGGFGGANKGMKVRDVWIDGVRHEINPAPAMKLEGEWAVTLDGGPEGARLTIDDKNAITAWLGDKKTRARDVKISDNRVSFLVDDADLGLEGTSIVSGVVEGDEIHGTAIDANGKMITWSARRTAAKPEETKNPKEEKAAAGFVGEFRLTETDGQPRDPNDEAIISIKDEKTASVTVHGRTVQADSVTIAGDRIDLAVDGSLIDQQGMIVIRATRDGDTLRGTAIPPEGDKHEFVAKRTTAQPGPDAERPRRAGRNEPPGGAKRKDPEQEEREAIASIPDELGYPFGPYMLAKQPEQETVRLIDATIWTEGPQGVIQNGEVVIDKGKITYVGPRQGLLPDGQDKKLGTRIDCAGKHISPGVIDCHSHTGISRGVNEGGQAVTAEVRIEDVTDPDSISWYRQLASGVTSVNSLHGSANAIGGQNCVNKNRWGVQHPDQMHFEGAMPGIKFALGENPKWSNSGDRSNNRYPQTRMGVETLIRDRFTAAQEYRALWDSSRVADLSPRTLTPQEIAAVRKRTEEVKRMMEGLEVLKREHHDSREYASQYEAAAAEYKRLEAQATSLFRPSQRSTTAGPPRRDLELEALAEILEGKRLVHCHSYRQDEILMLCRVADDFGFKIGTFQHILEGYKVADEVAKHSLGGSCFSDWWAYKVEVQDAIPAGGPIMAEEGVVVSFNSDSDELARRLNWETGKAIKYGQNVKPEEALKFVTINPARQLMIDKRVGSLEVGKDADLAIWSGPPMSAFSRCEATYVDGRRLFSLEDDAKHRDKIAAERKRLTQKLLAAAKSGRGGGESGSGSSGGGMRPGDDVESLRVFYLDLLNRAGDPAMARPGECGELGAR